jgi:hypothetical protein
MQKNNQSAPRRKRHPLALLHRYGGIVSAVLIILVCSSGLLLNHSDDLRLNRKTVSADWLLDWYGIEMPAATNYAFNDRFGTQLGETLYLDALPVPGTYTTLKGIAVTNELIVIATIDQLIVLTKNGEIVEAPGALHGIPSPIHRIGIRTTESDTQVVLDAGDKIWLGDAELLNWAVVNTARNIAWSSSTTTPAAIEQAIAEHYRGIGLTLEQLILDIHSGRFLGRAGPWLADAIALLFIMLALSGIWMWFRTRRTTT